MRNTTLLFVRRSLSAVVPALLAAGLAPAQSFIAQVKPAGSDLWGYASNTGEMVIKPAYKGCFRFNESGYAAVVDPATKNGAFINTKGERLTTSVPAFQLIGGLFSGADVQGFSCGLAPVKVGEKWGFLNTKGELAVPAAYDKVDAFESCLSVVEKNKKLFILTAEGKETPVADADIVDVKSFADGLAPFRTKGKLLGFMNGDQQVVIPAQYLSVGYFSGGLAWAKDKSEKHGFIDKQGAWVIGAKYDAAKEMDPGTGLARVKSGDAWLYVDRTGKEVSVAGAEGLGDFGDGLAEAKRGELVGFIGPDGSWVIEPKFNGARAFKNGFAAVKQGEKWGFIDTKGNWVIEPGYDSVKDMEKVQ